MQSDFSKVEQNPIMFCVLAFYFFAHEDFNTLLFLLHKTKNQE